MRLRGLISAVAALALLASAPALGQEGDTSESDLRCAAWAAVMAGSNPGPEAASGLAVTMTWFLGRYEAATGTPFEQALSAAYLLALEPQIQAVQTECLPRMQEMGTRLQAWGAQLSAMDPAAPPL